MKLVPLLTKKLQSAIRCNIPVKWSPGLTSPGEMDGAKYGSPGLHPRKKRVK